MWLSLGLNKYFLACHAKSQYTVKLLFLMFGWCIGCWLFLSTFFFYLISLLSLSFKLPHFWTKLTKTPQQNLYWVVSFPGFWNSGNFYQLWSLYLYKRLRLWFAGLSVHPSSVRQSFLSFREWGKCIGRWFGSGIQGLGI